MQQAQNTGSRGTSWQTLTDRHGRIRLLLPEGDIAESWRRVHGWPAILYYVSALVASVTHKATLRYGMWSRSLEVKSSLIKNVFPLLD